MLIWLGNNQELAKEALHPPPPPEDPVVEPLPESATASILDSDPNAIQEWYESGLEAIGRGEVGVILMGIYTSKIFNFYLDNMLT